MLMDKHRSTFIFTLKATSWLIKWVSSQYQLPISLQLCALDKQGSASVSLMGYPMNRWMKKRNENHPTMRCILSRFVSTTTLMFLLRWYLHILLVKKTPILSLMLIISFTVTKFPQVFLGLSRIRLLNAMSMSHYFFCRSQGAGFCTLT